MAKKTNFETNGNKYFRVTLTIGYDENGKQKQKTFYGKTKKEAEIKKQEYLDNLNNGISNDNKHFITTFSDWLNNVLYITVKPNTFSRYDGIFRNYISKSKFKYMNLKDITSMEIQKYYNELYLTKSENQVINLNKLLNKFFNYCVKEDYILKNPCMNVVLKKSNRKSIDPEDIFTFEEIKIMKESEDCLCKFLGLLCIGTGLRRGEALGLKWSDIDYNNRLINIQRTLVSYSKVIDSNTRKKVTETTTPKTESSIRSIPLNDNLIDLFLEIKEFFNKRKIKAGEYYNNEYDGMIFLNKVGNLIEPSNLTKEWYKYLESINLRKRRFHSTRHSYITIQYELGTKPLTISRLAGHSNTSTTEKIYTHLSNNEKDKAKDIFTHI